jgi:hypothetical protein
MVILVSERRLRSGSVTCLSRCEIHDGLILTVSPLSPALIYREPTSYFARVSSSNGYDKVKLSPQITERADGGLIGFVL